MPAALETDPDEAVIRTIATERLGPDPSAYRDAWSRGATLDLSDLIDIAGGIVADRRASLVA